MTRSRDLFKHDSAEACRTVLEGNAQVTCGASLSVCMKGRLCQLKAVIDMLASDPSLELHTSSLTLQRQLRKIHGSM